MPRGHKHESEEARREARRASARRSYLKRKAERENYGSNLRGLFKEHHHKRRVSRRVRNVPHLGSNLARLFREPRREHHHHRREHHHHRERHSVNAGGANMRALFSERKRRSNSGTRRGPRHFPRDERLFE